MSSPLTLELTRHELFSLPPDTPAVGEAFRVEVTSEKRPAFWALARMVFVNKGYKGHQGREIHRVFFRDEARPKDEIFSHMRVNLSPGETSNLEKLMKKVSEAVNSPRVTRIWQLPDLALALALRVPGVGIIIEDYDPQGETGRFRWSNGSDERLWTWDTREFHEFCREMILDPTSELNFLLSWRKLTPDEKTDISTCCKSGDWNDLLRLFTWVLQLVTHHFGPYSFKGNPSSQWVFAQPIHSKYDQPAALLARRWQNIIFSIVRPTFWPDEAMCQVDWRSYKAGVENSVTCEIPTQHEVLEAQLGLRDFLRPHLSAQEIEALFSPA